jgi:hypothetical protein
MSLRACSSVLMSAGWMLVVAFRPLSAQTLQPSPVSQFTLEAEEPPKSHSDNPLISAATREANGTSIASFMADAAKKTPTAGRDIPEISADLVRFLRGDPSTVVSELKSLGNRYDLIVSAAKNGDSTAQRTILAALFLDRPTMDKVVDSLRVVDSVAAGQLVSDITEARRLLAGYTGNVVTAALLAQGAVRSGLSGSSNAGTAGTGSIGLTFSQGSWQLTGLVTVASSVDTLRSGFGSFILTPASGRNSLSTFLVDLHTPSIARIWSKQEPSPLWPAAHVYFTGANSIWERLTPSADLADTAKSYKQAAVLGLGTLLSWQIKRGRLLNVPVQITVETGYSRRYLRGDVFADTAFIRGTLHPPDESVKKSWGAWETGFQMGIGAVTAGVQYYWVDGNNDKSFISGLTSGQLVIGIAVAGDIVSGILSD